MPSVIDRLVGTTTANEMQQNLSCGEVHYLWLHLAEKYDIIEVLQVFQNFASDADFKALITLALRDLEQKATVAENEMHRLGLPMPPRCPKDVTTSTNTEALRDELMFRLIFYGLKTLIDTDTDGLRTMGSPRLRKLYFQWIKDFTEHLVRLCEYGEVKGWLRLPPDYHPTQI